VPAGTEGEPTEEPRTRGVTVTGSIEAGTYTGMPSVHKSLFWQVTGRGAGSFRAGYIECRPRNFR
jgi:hypothetical protein